MNRKEQIRVALREGDKTAGRSRGGGRPASAYLPVARLITMAAIAIALGHLDAAAAVYMREIAGAVPTSGSMTPKALEALPGWVEAVEQTRQVAAVLVLIAAATLAARTALQGLGAFLFGIGLWTIARYAGLKLMVQWPTSLSATDVWWMTPRAVFAPVWAILLGACVAASLGLLCLRAGRRG